MAAFCPQKSFTELYSTEKRKMKGEKKVCEQLAADHTPGVEKNSMKEQEKQG